MARRGGQPVPGTRLPGRAASRTEARLPQLGDFLSRFRPAGAPGAATRAGVPADREAERAAELEPVLGLLAGTEQECAAITTAAGLEADRIVAGARTDAAAIRAQAARDAAVAREEAAARVLAAAREQAAREEQAARDQVASRPAAAPQDVEDLVQAALDLVLALAGREAGA